jgi:hypothetical protein
VGSAFAASEDPPIVALPNLTVEGDRFERTRGDLAESLRLQGRW